MLRKSFQRWEKFFMVVDKMSKVQSLKCENKFKIGEKKFERQTRFRRESTVLGTMSTSMKLN